jgi:hypothetical protein
MCDVLDRCPNAFGTPLAYRSRNECAAILGFLITCRLNREELGDRQDRYVVEQIEPEIDATQLDACLEWLASASCEELQLGRDDSPCGNVILFDDDDEATDPPDPPADLDELCEDDEDCLEKLFCAGSKVDKQKGIETCRVCRPRIGEGEDCRQARCLPPLYCKLQGEYAACNEPGANCDLLCAKPEADDFRCYADEQCASGWCNTLRDDLGGWGRCDPGGELGDPCEGDYDPFGEILMVCRPEFHCEEATCQDKRPNGSPCSDNYACEIGQCDEETHICGRRDGSSCGYQAECETNICIEGICGLPGDGKCLLDEHCAGDEYCAGACQPPNCSCSGCPVGQCTSGNGSTGCEEDRHCASGMCEDGVCVQPKQLGDPCSAPYECYPIGRCENGVCVSAAGPGETCTGLDSCQQPFLCIDGRCEVMNLTCAPARAGELCAWLRVCDEDSYCDLLGGVRCKKRAQVGKPCETSLIPGVKTCVVGAACRFDEASGDNRCVALPTTGEVCSEACAEESFCWEGTCQADPVGSFCDYDKPCPDDLRCHDDREVCVPQSTEGGECESISDCVDDLFCEDRTCAPPKGLDAECYENVECREELFCSNDSRTCVKDLGLGEACSTSADNPCAAGLYCDSGTCLAAAGLGESCSSNRECESGICFHSFCAVQDQCVMP